jgi:hypothetical protein
VRALKIQFILMLVAMALAITVPLRSRAQQPASSTPSLSEIIAHMEAARIQSKDTVPFQLTREYRMYHDDDAKPTSEVKAEINVVPPHARDYKILEAKGSDRGEKVVRKILDHESEAEKVNPSPTALIPSNYDFALLGDDHFQGTRCYVLQLKPKRKDPSLIDGRAWIDANSFLIRKVEGQMSKSPSWWVKDVKLTVMFGEIGGIWTQLSSDATANVRIMGRYSVSGRATNVQTSSSMASLRQKKALPRERRTSVPAQVLYNTGILVAR